MHVNYVTTTKQPDHSPHCKEILHYIHVFSVYAIRETFCSYIHKFKVWILSHLQCYVPHNQGIFYQAIQVTCKTTTQPFGHLLFYSMDPVHYVTNSCNSYGSVTQHIANCSELKALEIHYCITGKFGGGKVWRIDSFWAFGERKFGKSLDQPIDYWL